MAKITYITNSGAVFAVDVASGFSVMEGAVRNNVPGIDAECGGACACATCHVFVDPKWLGKLAPKTAAEADLLEAVDSAEANSRLSCQIRVVDDLDGLVVRLPKSQH